MPEQHILQEQLQLLAHHRGTLAGLLQQQALLGVAFAPPANFNSIRMARSEIRRIKAWLRKQRHPVEDLPDDNDPDAATIQQRRVGTLHAHFANHTGFINDRLGSFVGRTTELAAIRQRIAAHLPTGGYVTITGQAGQGKSSIIAALLAQHSHAESLHALITADAETLLIEPVSAEAVEAIAHHFIPFNPGPDHQVSLLRNLIARLALIFNLPEIYVASDSRPALKDYFATVMAAVATSGAQVLIYIDGLDQIEEDSSGVRDLSFLPANPPPGIVFVLGTRPNDTLKPLQLLKPRIEYQLPDLSRADFSLVLQHRNITLVPDLADRFYTIMDSNALFLDLAAREIGAAGALPPEQIIQQLANDPANLFSFAIARLKRPREVWYEVVKPTLGALLATRDSLSHTALRALTRADADTLREVLQRLGGLVARDEHGRYYLFHLKLREFLGGQLKRIDDTAASTPFFDTDEAAGYHQRLATWCEGGKGGLATIWQPLLTDAGEQERRAYARQHYITHLAAAQNWDQLWAAIDTGDYGRAKLRHDPSTRAYVQDLDRTRQTVLAAADDLAEPVTITLPRLWRYSLLRNTLTSQADNYPNSMFTILAHVGRAQEAIDLAELLSDMHRKARVLCAIGIALDNIDGVTKTGQPIITRAIAVARSIEHPVEQSRLLITLASHLKHANRLEDANTLWAEATRIASTIEDVGSRAITLGVVAQAMAKAGQLTPAIDLAHTIEDAGSRAITIGVIAQELAAVGQLTSAIDLAHTIEDGVSRVTALGAVAQALAKAGQVTVANTLCAEATHSARTIEETVSRVAALGAVAQALAKAGQVTVANTLYAEAMKNAHTIEDAPRRSEALRMVAYILAAAGQFTPAIDLARTIEGKNSRAAALRDIAQAMAKAGQFTSAIDLARTIELRLSRAATLRAVVQTLAIAGQYTLATKLIDTIEGAPNRAATLRDIAQAMAKAGQFTSAIDLAHTIEFTPSRAAALSDIGQTLVNAGQVAAAIPLCDETAYIVRTIENTGSRVVALRGIIEMLASTGQFTSAIDLAHSIKDATMHAVIICDITQMLASAEQFASAIDLAHTIELVPRRAVALSAVAQALANAGQFTSAIDLAHTIELVPRRAVALSAVAQALANAGQFTSAIDLAHTIELAPRRAEVLSAVAQALAGTGQFASAIDLAHTIEFAPSRAATLGDVAQVLAKAGQATAAITLCTEAACIARTIENVSRRAAALRDVAEALAKAGHFTSAIELAHTIEDVSCRAAALRNVVQILATTGQFTSAINLACTIEFAPNRATTLRNVVQALVAAGQFTSATDLARTIEFAPICAAALCDIAQALAAVERAADVSTLCVEATRIAHTIESVYTRAGVLRDIVQTLTVAGQFTSAIDLARTIELAPRRAAALRDIAESLAKAGQFTSAIDLARTIEAASNRTIALRDIAESLAKAGHFTSAIDLARTIEDSMKRAEGLRAVAMEFERANDSLQLHVLVTQSWLHASTYQEIWQLLSLAHRFIIADPALLPALLSATDWVHDFLQVT